VGRVKSMLKKVLYVLNAMALDHSEEHLLHNAQSVEDEDFDLVIWVYEKFVKNVKVLEDL